MSAITLKGLTKQFGSTTAVDQVDLVIASGELFFLLGPSGCGKTTLLRMIAGFIEPTAGTIFFGEKNVTNLPPNRRNAGMVFQSYALWPHMTVEENVAYGLKVRKIETGERRDRTAAALKSVHMHEYAKRKPNQLSGGQQQRVALARALVIEPTVLLLDEPLSNLDAKLRLEMRWEIKRICSETKITTVYVTHDQKEALSMADNMAVLRNGRIAQIGAPRCLYEQPNSRFVADFLGETNFIKGIVVEILDAEIVLSTAAGMLRSRRKITTQPNATVTCSIRPEAIRILKDTNQTAPNMIVGKRVRSMYLGESAQHQVQLPDGTLVLVTEVNPASDDVAHDVFRLAIDPSDVVVIEEY